MTVQIDVVHDRQLVPRATHVAQLQHRSAVSESLLNLQVVIVEVGSLEVLAHRKNIVRVTPTAAERWTGDIGRKDERIRLPREGPGTIVGDRRRPARVVLQTICSGASRPEIKERVHVDLVEEDADSAAHHEALARGGLVSKAKPRCKVVAVGGENRVDAIALDQQAAIRRKDCQVLIHTVKWPNILVAQAEIDIQFASYLPGILAEEVESIDSDFAFRVSYRERSRSHVAGEEIGERTRGIARNTCGG